MEHTEKLFKESLLVAELVHRNQTYDSVFPYMKHIIDVVDVLKRFGITQPKYLIAAALHDSLEDGAISYTKLKRHFGEEIAEMVYCVTDEMGRTRDEKKRKTLPKTASNSDAVIIKLADRIANIEHGGKVDMYAKEYKAFKDALYHPDRFALPMWVHLEKLLKIKS